MVQVGCSSWYLDSERQEAQVKVVTGGGVKPRRKVQAFQRPRRRGRRSSSAWKTELRRACAVVLWADFLRVTLAEGHEQWLGGRADLDDR